MKAYSNIEIQAVPDQPAHAARIADVDAKIPKISWIMEPARVLEAQNFWFDNDTHYDHMAGTLTLDQPGAVVLDGVQVGQGDRVILQNNFSPIRNGVYVVKVKGSDSVQTVFERSPDCSEYINPDHWVRPGQLINVLEGSQGAMTTRILKQVPGNGWTSGSLSFIEYEPVKNRIWTDSQWIDGFAGNTQDQYDFTIPGDWTAASVDMFAVVGSIHLKVYIDYAIDIDAKQIAVKLANPPLTGDKYHLLITFSK